MVELQRCHPTRGTMQRRGFVASPIGMMARLGCALLLGRAIGRRTAQPCRASLGEPSLGEPSPIRRGTRGVPLGARPPTEKLGILAMRAEEEAQRQIRRFVRATS